MNIIDIRLRRAPLVAFALVVALAVAACGSSSSGGSTSKTASTSSSRAKFAACLKQHGVTLPSGRGAKGHFGSPPSGGSASGTGTSSSGTGTRPSGTRPGGFLGFGNSKFAKAAKACGGFRRAFPGGHGFPARAGHFRSRFSSATLAAFSKCVKKHGYTLPKANTSGRGSIFPRSIESNAKFKQAAAKCSSLLHTTQGVGTGTTSSSTSSS